ncbi:glycoside hydrolase family 3 N-terminal domain-containing protein [Diplocloster agilis]|uniref:Glycoside hydrolase family 3 C-terminal domain-containing protein n=1 Tax=Diplocloster agilis TaxID=2850323 RepID=A0A949JV32_9FIRM|nr:MULTISPECIES: glycoside hydrolase family 3 N-terminal domain-containing protein [Lachnospiraceae]MBU9735680.1 glycoside hydrolase family 3 C-terminal domain-containing protein [Diplocloster agilis]MCU6732418.1 glycoside hydrolase family 3 C-terminal domain-containing protein [Suonthocola fibrivorans]SCI46397.1 Periplasmic beta-glucosidase precursor [uncultured Clostridium sp.]
MEIYKDSTQPVQDRVEDLLKRMTLREKVGQLNQTIYGWEGYIKKGTGFELTDTFRKEVAFGDGVGAIYAPFRADGWNIKDFPGVTAKESAMVVNLFQKYLIENTRLGIPALISEECPHGHEALEGTSIPVNVGIGSTFNPALYQEAAKGVAAQIRIRGCTLGLVSCLDILQEPRWGRSEESFGEDPYLAARMCENAVWGFQGEQLEDLKNNNKIVAVLKHLCGFGAPIGAHSGICSNIGEREMREIHLPGMKAGVRAGALACMAAYNDIDGVPCHMNAKLLKDIIRNEYGFQGIVMSDGCAIDMLEEQYGGYENAGAASLSAGVDLNLWNQSFLKLQEAVENKKVREEDIDQAVRHILYVKFILGLFENPYAQEELVDQVIHDRRMKEINLQLAEESAVLLENKNQLLPLGKDIGTIAVIGPNAHSIYNMLGDFTSWKKEEDVYTILDGIREVFSNSQILYEKGCGIRNEARDGFAAAVKAAEKADVVILALGGSSARNPEVVYGKNGAAEIVRYNTEVDTGEGRDIAELNIGAVQRELAEEIFKIGKPVIVLNISGRPFSLDWAKQADALLQVWYPGEMGGLAIAKILSGETCPSGRLSVSIPRSSGQLPVYYNHKGHRNFTDMSPEPAYPFGYGLSYTTFSYTKLTAGNISRAELQNGGRIRVSVDVTNTGTVAGKETVLLFVRDLQSCVTRRVKELKGFDKIDLMPGETKTVSLFLGEEELSIWDLNMNFVVEPGELLLMVGTEEIKVVIE